MEMSDYVKRINLLSGYDADNLSSISLVLVTFEL